MRYTFDSVSFSLDGIQAVSSPKSGAKKALSKRLRRSVWWKIDRQAPPIEK
jgi:hypothetical protein